MVAFAPLILKFFSVNNQIIIKNIFFQFFSQFVFFFFISGGCIHLFNFLCPRCFSFVSLSWWPKRFPSTAFVVRAKSVVAVFGRFISSTSSFFYFFWINQVQVTRLLNFAHLYVKRRQRNTKTWLIAFS